MSDFSMQIELWTECNNFCEFCYLGEANKFVSDEVKLHNIARASKIITDYFNTHDENIKAIGFLGGEFFQGQMKNPEVKKAFYNLCKQVFDLINANRVQDFWCYCTLTIGDQEDLYTLIELFNNTIIDKKNHHFWIQVSYDQKGRFTLPGKFENWNKHLLKLQQYSFTRFNITSIMTEPFLQAVLNNELNLTEFQNKYKTTFFLKQANCITDTLKQETAQKLPWFFPKRKTYLAFLQKLRLENPNLFDNLLNITLRSDYMYSQLDDADLSEGLNIRNKETWEEYGSEVIQKCGHSVNYQCYADSDACMLCDYFKVKEEGF